MTLLFSSGISESGSGESDAKPPAPPSITGVRAFICDVAVRKGHICVTKFKLKQEVHRLFAELLFFLNAL